MTHYQSCSLFDRRSCLGDRGNSRANTSAKTQLLGRVGFILANLPNIMDFRGFDSSTT